MSQFRSHLVIFAAAALLSGCSYVDSVFTGEDTSDEDQYVSADAEQAGMPASTAEPNAQPTVTQAPSVAPAAVGAGNDASRSATPGGSTGTYVGQQVASLRGDLERLQGNINQHNQELQQAHQAIASDGGSYYSVVGSINSRLQAGTAPGNPELMAQWSQAQSSLGRLNDEITRLSTILNATASDSALGAYILESVRAAYKLPGAVDEDRRQLAILEDDCGRTIVLIDKLLNDIREDINRQSNYASNERRNLTALSVAIKNGELYADSIKNPAVANAAAQQVASATPVDSGRQPLVVIRFHRPNVAYEQALYSAVSRALDRRPSAIFDVVAVAPAGGKAGQPALDTKTSARNAEAVARSLTSMGLPPDRISLAAMSSSSAQANEVQVFVR